MELIAITKDNYSEVAVIYQEGILTGTATFETEVPSWELWDAAHLTEGRILAVQAGEVLGWGSLSPVSSRCAYRGVAEVSVYVGSKARGMGVGEFLLRALIRLSEDHGLWSLQSGVFPQNEASIRLHLKCGFREIGTTEKIGKLQGQWMDTVLLEKRSTVVGV